MVQVHTVESILRQWDPIGVLPGEFAPADEYDGYAPHIVSMVAKNCSIQDLTRHLEAIRTQTIGVEADAIRDKETAVEIIRALRIRVVK